MTRSCEGAAPIVADLRRQAESRPRPAFRRSESAWTLHNECVRLANEILLTTGAPAQMLAGASVNAYSDGELPRLKYLLFREAAGDAIHDLAAYAQELRDERLARTPREQGPTEGTAAIAPVQDLGNGWDLFRCDHKGNLAPTGIAYIAIHRDTGKTTEAYLYVDSVGFELKRRGAI